MTKLNREIPIFIISKGRWDSRLTHRYLHEWGIPHHMVVEQQEYDKYAAVVGDTCTLVVLDERYKDDYDTCDNEGDRISKGSGPARNFVWDLAVSLGAEWHWIMDDNIRGFYRRNRNMKIPLKSDKMLVACEQFVLRYTNVAMAGPHYFMFAPRKRKKPPFTLNTRIFSCNMIRCDTGYRWRGRYNEDVELSLRMLKDGWCTILFNAFLQDKMTTQTMKGGNTAAFYASEGTLPKSQMLKRLHPDVTKVTWRFGRWHHHVDFSGFTQRLKRRDDAIIQEGVDEHGMQLSKKNGKGWEPMDPQLLNKEQPNA